jgi:phosphatidylglycerol:prolipoprotein diacylglycerol transferase
MHPILIDFGFFQLPSYGVLLATAVVVALWTLRLRADRAGMDGTRLVDFGLWLVIWALLGAKLLLILVEFPRYIRDPASILGTIRAGGVFLGGFIAAAIAAIVLLRRYELPALPTFDVISPSLALGHSIGRSGCLLAGLYKKRPASGRVFASYLLLYGVGRFFLEFTRGDAARGFVLDGLLSTSQLISLALVCTGAGLHLWLTRRKAA